jgi:hypothetical protein
MSALPVAGACGPSGQPAGAPEPAKAPPATSTPAPAPPPSTPSLVPENVTPTVAEHMKDHFSQALRARDALVRGDLAAMKKPAAWLADHRLSETLPEAWRPHVGDMQNAAKLAEQADDLAVAADAVGAMGAACGRCHQALGATVQFAGQSPEGKESSVADRMMRHRWAEARMWEGLVGPSDVSWNAGVAALQDAPLHPEMLANNRSPPKEVVDLANRVHSVGLRGKLTKDPEPRARLYGEYLATCEACHAKLDARVPPLM